MMTDLIEMEINKEMEEQNKILAQMDSILGMKQEQERANYSGLSQELRGILRGKKGKCIRQTSHFLLYQIVMKNKRIFILNKKVIEEDEDVQSAKKKKKPKVIYEEDEEEDDDIPKELKEKGNEERLKRFIEMRQKRWRVDTKDASTEVDRNI